MRGGENPCYPTKFTAGPGTRTARVRVKGIPTTRLSLCGGFPFSSSPTFPCPACPPYVRTESVTRRSHIALLSGSVQYQYTPALPYRRFTEMGVHKIGILTLSGCALGQP